MQFIKLETLEQIMNLKKGDLLIVNWGNGWDVKAYKIYGLIAGGTEVLLSRKRNYYFIVNMYLHGASNVKEAYLATKDEDKVSLAINYNTLVGISEPEGLNHTDTLKFELSEEVIVNCKCGWFDNNREDIAIVIETDIRSPHYRVKHSDNCQFWHQKECLSKLQQ